MTTPTPGRNDLCHCGSGLKYKRCHLEADLAAQRGAHVRAAPLPKTDLFANPRLAARANGIGEALLQITAGRLEALPLARMVKLLARGEALENVRFDHTRFAEAFTRHASTEAVKNAPEPWRALFAAAVPELVPSAVALRRTWTDVILDRLENEPDPDDTKALETALAMLLVGEITADLPVAELPFFDEVFRAQLTAFGAAEDAVKGFLAQQTAGVPEAQELTKLLASHPALRGKLEALSPKLLGALAPDLDQALALTTAAVTSKTPPAVLTLDELLWFETRFLQLLSAVPTQDRTDDEVKRGRSEAAVTLLREAAEEFGDAARDRAGKLALDTRLGEPAKQVARQLFLALTSEPVKVMLALVRAPDRPVQWRNGLERKAFTKLRSKSGPEGLDDYATFLDQAGELDGSTRVRHVLQMRKAAT